MNWALIGYGGMGHWHVDKLKTIDEINICGIYDILPERRAEAERLQDLEREIIVRRYLDEQTPKEISLAVGIDVKKVRNILFRAKQKLTGSTVKKGI